MDEAWINNRRYLFEMRLADIRAKSAADEKRMWQEFVKEACGDSKPSIEKLIKGLMARIERNEMNCGDLLRKIESLATPWDAPKFAALLEWKPLYVRDDRGVRGVLLDVLGGIGNRQTIAALESSKDLFGSINCRSHEKGLMFVGRGSEEEMRAFDLKDIDEAIARINARINNGSFAEWVWLKIGPR
jgi:hypothetical protein